MSISNRDWYYNQFDVEKKGGVFDLDHSKTSELDAQDLSGSVRAQWETDFIDDLYGTTGGKTIYKGEDLGHSLEQWTGDLTGFYDSNVHKVGRNYRGSTGQRLDAEMDTWGLDLRRKAYEEGAFETGSNEHYLWLTRGPVDWADYENDNEFKRVFNEMKKDSKAWDTYGSPANIEFLTSDEYTDKEKVMFVRQANIRLGSAEKKSDKEQEFEDGWYDWDSKYVYTDPNTLKGYTEKALFDPASTEITDRIVDADGKRMTIRTDIATPTEVTKIKIDRRNISLGVDFNSIPDLSNAVVRPPNIPTTWGPVGGNQGGSGRPGRPKPPSNDGPRDVTGPPPPTTQSTVKSDR